MMALIAHDPSQELIDLVGALGGRWEGRAALCRCPAHDDTNPSLSLRQGDRGILVTCFAGCARAEVLRALSRISGRGLPSGRVMAASPRSSGAERLWSAGQPVEGTLAERYLASRNLPPDLGDLRYLPRCPHGPRPRTLFEPALLAAVREGRSLVAVQRIFLDARTARRTSRALLGSPGAGAWAGQGRGPTLALAEGVETAAAFTALTRVPCWAALGAERLDRIALPAGLSLLLLAEDNDAAGRRAAMRAMARHARAGLTIRRTPPAARFNDWAQQLDAEVKREGGAGG